ncbi:MAG: helix-turn-helix domain-containing protein [Legionella sp.]|nr:helix-turn-helix domain-containing protein [Legionella sp.]
MNTSTTMDELNQAEKENPGKQLATLRQQKGYTTEYVANKLHLRVRIIELLENSDYQLLPEPVFIKGYLRAYAKLLGVCPEPFVALFNSQYDFENKPERALWQSRRETHKAEYMIRWFTIVFAIGVMIAVGIWWHKNRDIQSTYSNKDNTTELALDQVTEIPPTDLSTIETLLSPEAHMSLMGKKDV